MNDNRNSQRRRIFAVILTLTGVSIGLLLAILAAWADYESTAYGFMRRAQTPFQGLSCPVFMGKNETGSISINISNPTDRTLSPAVRTEVSTSQELDSKIDYVKLAPGEQVAVQRTIGPQNIDLGDFIFVYALVHSAYPLPSRENTCGILVLPVTNGRLILIFGTACSMLGMAAGMFLLYKNELPARLPASLSFLSIATVFALIFGFIGWWVQATILIVISILTLVITTGNLFRS